MMGLTARQAECLDFIRRSTAAGSSAPSFDEIAHELGVVKSNVHRLVHALIERGYVRQLPGRRRSVSLIEPHLRGDTEGVLAFLARRTGKSRDELVTQAIEEFVLRQVAS